MSDLENLKKSERIIALILQDLLETGLCYGTELSIEELDIEATEENEDFFQGCCLWLLDEGIVRCTNYDQVRKGAPMVNPVISAHGFALLGQTFLSETNEKLGDAVKKVAEGSTSYSGWGDFVGGILGGFTKSISS